MYSTMKKDCNYIKKCEVLVQCMTYNHSKYITDALNGFAIQKTDFPFVCLVMDDASTDGEQKVIRDFLNRECLMDKAEHYDHELADIVIVGHKTNLNCTFAVYFLKTNLYNTGKKRTLINEWSSNSEYIALCEGDDYWIDPYKLQKQVAILENNIDCSLVLSNGYTGPSYKDRNIINPYGEQPSGYIDIHSLLISSGGLVPTASMCYRSSLNKMPEFFYDCPVGDKPLRMWCAINGRVFYDNTPQVFYRQNVGGSFTNRVKVDKPYADYVYSGFCNFLDHFNDYTTHRFASEIDYMKKKEEYMYLFRIKDESRFKCYYFLHHTPLKFRIKKLICYALRIEK